MVFVSPNFTRMNTTYAKCVTYLERTSILLFAGRFFFILIQRHLLWYVNPRALWFLCLGWGIILCISIVSFTDKHTSLHKNHVVSIMTSIALLILVSIPTQTLHTNTATSVHVVSEQTTELKLPKTTEKYTFADWTTYLGSGKPQDELEGNIFSASGFLASYDTEKNTFELGRLVVTCCSADSYLTTISIDTNGLPENLVSDAWYDVRGVWHQTSEGEWIVTAHKITPVSIPNDPYVYP